MDRVQPSAAEWEDIRWLASDDAQRFLASWSGEEEVPPRDLATVRRTYGALRSHLLLEQRLLRKRATAKFAAAARMLFTRVGLEQATEETIAVYKGRRFPPSGPIADLCCGIGGDLLGLARGGAAITGIDRDPILAFFAEYNLEVGLEPVAHASHPHRVMVADACQFDLASRSAWHIDPDRRPHGRRTIRPDEYEPTLSQLRDMLRVQPNAAIKAAPAALLPADWESSLEREWISTRGECRQQVIWCGQLAARPGERIATRLGPTASGRVLSLRGTGERIPEVAEAIGPYLYDTDPAVRAAELIGELACRHQLRVVSREASYLTGSARELDDFLTPFLVLEVLPFDRRRVKAWLRARGIGSLEIKQRGTGHDLERLRRALRCEGEEHATLFLFRTGRRELAVFARRLAHEVEDLVGTTH